LFVNRDGNAKANTYNANILSSMEMTLSMRNAFIMHPGINVIFAVLAYAGTNAVAKIGGCRISVHKLPTSNRSGDFLAQADVLPEVRFGFEKRNRRRCE